jgi:glycosyltransferase involved in cell wall biosynthesis
VRIAVIAHALRTAGGLSVGKNLLAAIIRAAPEHEYLVTMPSGSDYEAICQGFPRVRISRCRPGGKRLARNVYEFITLPRVVRAFRPDVVLGLGNHGVLGVNCPQAILCHNAHLFYPGKHSGRTGRIGRRLSSLRLRKWYLRHNLRSTQLLLCQTEAAVERATGYYGYTGRTMVCPNAISSFIPVNRQNPPLPAHLKPWIDHFRLFYLARYYPHKNLEALVDVFRRYRASLKNVVAVITISEDHHPGATRLLRAVSKYRLDQQIINVGPLDQSELGAYFQNCHALVMPTLLESFSETYLEAMHFGLPILTSDQDFARAVCGDAALYFDPWNPASIRDAIVQIRNDRRLAEALARRGRDRLRTVTKSWDDIAVELLEELTDIAGGFPETRAA